MRSIFKSPADGYWKGKKKSSSRGGARKAFRILGSVARSTSRSLGKLLSFKLPKLPKGRSKKAKSTTTIYSSDASADIQADSGCLAIFGIVVLIFFLKIAVFDGTSTTQAYSKLARSGTVCAKSGLKLRDRAGTGGNRICTIPNNKSFAVITIDGPVDTIEGITGKWIQVEYANKRGWLFDGFVRYH